VGNLEMRKQLASLSFTEKIEILEKLRDRSLAFGSAGFRDRNNDKQKSYCSCEDWEPCGCGNQPPYHCMWCCRELNSEQLDIARARGFYSGKREK